MAKIVAIGGCVVFGAFCALSVIWAQAESAAAPQADQASVAAGRRLFAETCGNDFCHGQGGTGAGATSLINRRFSAEYLRFVISEGLPGTAMPPFKEVFTPEEIAQLVAYCLSLSPGHTGTNATAPTPPSPEPAPPVSEAPTSGAPASGTAADMRADAAAGQAVFFDATETHSCHVCHTFRAKGGQVGPDLTKASTKPPRELLLSIVVPAAVVDSATATLAVTTRDGHRVVGVKRDETGDSIRLYDTSSLPPVLRAVPKADVAKIDTLNVSAMPSDYASRYSLKQLLDLVAFLKSADPAAQAGVTLKDPF